MEKHQVVEKLSKYGTVKAFSEKRVLVCLMKGENFTKSNPFFQICQIVQEYAGDRFPIMETMVNEEDFILIVLAPKKAIL